MSGDLQTYQSMRVMTSSEKFETTDEPYVSNNDVAEAERLQALAGAGLGSTLLDDESREMEEVLGELGMFAQQEDPR